MKTLISASGVEKEVRAPGGSLLSILTGVELNVNSGEAVALLGASGSGKSTLLGLLAGLDEPTAGDVMLLGQRLNALDEDARARLRLGRVGFVFQSFQLLPGMTAVENVGLPLKLSGLRNHQRQAMSLLEEVGLGERTDHLPRQLSGGEQQRVALARAFAGDPEILFADEPTGNLDPDTGQQVIDLMFSLRDRCATALVLVTHDEKLAGRCDRIYRLEYGKLKSVM
ncbi:ABC transporter ATP-binding protein [Thiolapillus sp.]